MRVRRVTGIVLLLIGAGLMLSYLVSIQNRIDTEMDQNATEMTWGAIVGTVMVIGGVLITVNSFRKRK